MNDPRDPPDQEGERPARSGVPEHEAPRSPASPTADPPEPAPRQGPQEPRRGSDLDAATGTLVGVGLGALIWAALILLYLRWHH